MPWDHAKFNVTSDVFLEPTIQLETIHTHGTATSFDLDELPLQLKCMLLLLKFDLPDDDLLVIYEALENLVRYHSELKPLPALSQKEGSTMISANDVAKYFIALVSEEEGELISNLKLQKLLYYAQGFSLAMLNKALFPERIEAWIHGPVVPAVYYEYKRYGRSGLPYKEVDFSQFDEDVRELLDEVYDVYGQYSASVLRNLTHEEPPWRNTPSGEEISQDNLKSYFLTQIIDGEEEKN